MIKVLSFLSNENCFAGHGLSTTAVEDNTHILRVILQSSDIYYLTRRMKIRLAVDFSNEVCNHCREIIVTSWKRLQNLCLCIGCLLLLSA